MALVTSEMLAVQAQATEYKLPELEISARAAKPIEGSKSSGQIDVVLVDPGTAYRSSGTTLKDITGLTNAGTQNKRSMTIKSVTTPAEIGSLQRVTDIESFTKEFAEPRANTMKAEIHNDIMESMMFGVNSAQVVNSSFGIEHLGVASGMLGELSVTDLFGFMSPTTETKLGTDAIKNYFLPPMISEAMYQEAKIGKYQGITWERCKMPQVAIASANVIAADWVIATGGVSATTGEITIDDGASSSTIGTSTVIKAGSTFTFAGVYALDQQNKTLPYLKTFVVQEDATGVVGGTVTVKVGQMIITGGGANVSKLPVATDVPIPGVGASVGTYSVLIATQRDNLLFEPVKLNNEGFQEASEGASDTGSILVSSIVVPDGNARTAIYRFDSAYVTGIIDSKLATSIYVKQ